MFPSRFGACTADSNTCGVFQTYGTTGRRVVLTAINGGPRSFDLVSGTDWFSVWNPDSPAPQWHTHQCDEVGASTALRKVEPTNTIYEARITRVYNKMVDNRTLYGLLCFIVRVITLKYSVSQQVWCLYGRFQHLRSVSNLWNHREMSRVDGHQRWT